MDEWAYRHGVSIEFNRPGPPTHNPFVESAGGHFRDQCLNQHWSRSLKEARTTIESWRVAYNTERPRRALGHQTSAGALRA